MFLPMLNVISFAIKKKTNVISLILYGYGIMGLRIQNVLLRTFHTAIPGHM